MGRSERHAFFERIVAMRDGYLASPDDRGTVLGPDHPGHPRRFASDLWPRPIRSSRSLRRGAV